MIGRGKDKGESGVGGSQSWRELGGSARRRVKSPWVWRRRLHLVGKILWVLCGLLLLSMGGYWLWQKASDAEEPIGISAPDQPLERILFRTDGVFAGSMVESYGGFEARIQFDADRHL